MTPTDRNTSHALIIVIYRVGVGTKPNRRLLFYQVLVRISCTAVISLLQFAALAEHHIAACYANQRTSVVD